ncbi:hypothetical protein [Methylobacterium sp. A54F]
MQPKPRLPAIADRAGADALVASILATMQALDAVLAQETSEVRAGRLKEALAQTERKRDLAAAYMQGLETAKANAIALARFAPEGIAGLKAAHQQFATRVEANQAVLATAKTVSEGLVRNLAAEIGRARTPSVYGAPSVGPSPYGTGARSGPLVLSRSL